jgi:hypothetical protein
MKGYAVEMHQHSSFTSALDPVTGEISRHSRFSPGLMSPRYSLNVRLDGLLAVRLWEKGRKHPLPGIKDFFFFGRPYLPFSLY